MKRRNFLALLGGGVVLAAGSTLGSVATRTPDKALTPWKLAGTAQYAEPRMRALSYAILAPNPHNRQPWLVDLSNENQIILTVDTDKLLPHTDPFSRQITIGLGCFLEVLHMAAAEDGYRADITVFPQGSDVMALDQRPIAVIDMVRDENVQPDPLFAHIFKRRSLKEPFDTSKEVSSKLLRDVADETLYTSTATTNDESHVAKLRKLTRDAFTIELDTPRTYKESVDLFRIGKKEIEANPDGIDFSGPMFETMGFLGLMSREGALDTNSIEFEEGKKAIYAQTDTGMAYLWVVTKGNTREDQINAGRDWVRINLATMRENVGLHPMSQALQEYEEMTAIYDQIHADLAPDGGTVQMFGRLGYAERVAPSPRWPIEAKILS
ncbi:MAG: twin-arginine translocation pathway signal protein [Lentilitoribacter sp.]